jgi:hypothetical protein
VIANAKYSSDVFNVAEDMISHMDLMTDMGQARPLQL